MTLAYLIVCPWEAVAIGKLMSYLVPEVSTIQIYSVAGKPVYLPALILGFATTVLIILLNYRGIRVSSRFQNYTTFVLLLFFGLFTLLGMTRVEPINFQPLFATVPNMISIVLVLQIVPYFLTGFESVPKCVEEADVNLDPKGLSRAIFLALGVGILFYVLILFVVSGLVAWQSLTTERYATAVAFQRAFGSDLLAQLILIAALFSLLKVFNGNFISASRLIFALGRGRWIAHGFGKIHPQFQTPHVSVLFCGAITFLGALLGDAILIPITEVGSMCSALGWLLTCIAFLKWRKTITMKEKAIATTGVIVATLLLLMKFVPVVPGSLGRWEYLALGIWLVIGLTLRRRS
jgi:amino acid transporter